MSPNNIKLEIHLSMTKIGDVINHKYQLYRGMLHGIPYFLCYNVNTGEPVDILNDRGCMITIPGIEPFFVSEYNNGSNIGGGQT